jgi:tetratricopeptide (TPR) repeat protein
MEPALATDFEGHPVARILTARIWAQLGVSLFARQPVFLDSGPDYHSLERRLVAARESWQRSVELDPSRIDGRIHAAYVHTLLDPHHPEGAETGVVVADRMLQADVLNMLGDAYFAAGRMDEARQRYAQSLDLLNLPQRKNFRAQKGLGGL